MGLNAALEDLIKTLPAEVQGQQRAILEKHPSLGEGWLRQADYDRRMNEVKGKVDKYDETMDWYKKSKPIHDQTLSDLRAANDRISSLEAEVQAKAAEASAAKAAAGVEGGDPAAVAKAVMESLKGAIPTAAEIGKLVAAETEKQAGAAQERFFKETVPAAMAFQTGMNDVQWRYQEEFGKRMNRAEFAKFMTDNKINDPIEAYDKYTEKDRREREVQSEVTKRVDEEKKKLQAEFVPGSTSSHGTGHLQARLNRKDEKDPLFGQDVELGDNASAMAAAAELRSQGVV